MVTVASTAPADAVDWEAVEKVAATLGPRSRGLVRVRNLDALRVWAPAAADATAVWSLDTALRYRLLARLVGADQDGAK
jgi:hypothetical protein